MTHRSGLGVVGGDGVVDVEENPRLVTGVDAWDRHEWSGRAAPTTSDRNLSARNVELSSAEGGSCVQCDGFHADEVPGRELIKVVRIRASIAQCFCTYSPVGRFFGTVKVTPGTSSENK